MEEEKAEPYKAGGLEDLEHQDDCKGGDKHRTEEEHMDGETNVAVPLPQTVPSASPSLNVQYPKIRRTRQKSISVPQGYLFAEPPQVVIRKWETPREFEVFDCFGGYVSGTECTDETPAHQRAHRRGTRVKKVSCPSHYLLHEAKG